MPVCAPMRILEKFPERSNESKLEGEKTAREIRVIVGLKTFVMHYKLYIYVFNYFHHLFPSTLYADVPLHVGSVLL